MISFVDHDLLTRHTGMGMGCQEYQAVRPESISDDALIVEILRKALSCTERRAENLQDDHRDPENEDLNGDLNRMESDIEDI